MQSPFNGVVLIEKEGKILFKQSYGYENIKSKSLLSTDSQFLIGSVTKQFTAMLVLQLIEQGKLSFDGTASDYLPYFPPIKGQHLTIHRLLSHTTGLPHYEGIRRLGMAYDEFR